MSEGNAHVLVSIAGPSGRNQQQRSLLSLDKLEWMRKVVLRQIRAWGLDPTNVCLVTGASAWTDHVGVLLFLEGAVGGLHLVSCKFDERERVFVNSGDGTHRGLNDAHEKMSRVTGSDSRAEIAEALSRGATHEATHCGFLERNTHVAASPYLIAFTLQGRTPNTAGTRDTWNKCVGTKVCHRII